MPCAPGGPLAPPGEPHHKEDPALPAATHTLSQPAPSSSTWRPACPITMRDHTRTLRVLHAPWTHLGEAAQPRGFVPLPPARQVVQQQRIGRDARRHLAAVAAPHQQLAAEEASHLAAHAKGAAGQVVMMATGVSTEQDCRAGEFQREGTASPSQQGRCGQGKQIMAPGPRTRHAAGWQSRSCTAAAMKRTKAPMVHAGMQSATHK